MLAQGDRRYGRHLATAHFQGIAPFATGGATAQQMRQRIQERQHAVMLEEE